MTTLTVGTYPGDKTRVRFLSGSHRLKMKAQKKAARPGNKLTRFMIHPPLELLCHWYAVCVPDQITQRACVIEHKRAVIEEHILYCGAAANWQMALVISAGRTSYMLATAPETVLAPNQHSWRSASHRQAPAAGLGLISLFIRHQ